MLVVGLTGGIGSGKSTVLRLFKKLGAETIDADKLAREVVKPGRPAWRDIRERFGRSVFHRNSALDRKKLGRIVFRDAKARKDLNEIIHPRVFEEEKRLIEDARRRKKKVVVVDAPLMIESGSHRWKDIIVVMSSTTEEQLRRLTNGPGRMSRKEAMARIESQMPLSKKLKHADFVIENRGTLAECRKNAEQVFRKILTSRT
jgi:dephospho-CoA kinase